ncbi:MAG: hypothetical protein A4E65_01720 [Syntrophorhabdus sp. PtaU1.Bin153]|nr:MAG: hypothetical protein A4E65_01720 [Syntrophorhabdus sp. PtaU1.Bin153]
MIDDYDPGTGQDANAGAAFGLNCRNNGGEGLRINNPEVNNFYGVKTESNAGLGVRVMSHARYNTFHNPHGEANRAGYYTCESSSTNNLLIGSYVFSATDLGSNIMIKAGGGTQNLSLAWRDLLINGPTPRYPAALDASLGIEGTAPGMYIYESDAPVDQKLWVWIADSSALRLKALSGPARAHEDVMTTSRKGNTVDFIRFPNGKVTFGGGIGVGNATAGD